MTRWQPSGSAGLLLPLPRELLLDRLDNSTLEVVLGILQADGCLGGSATDRGAGIRGVLQRLRRAPERLRHLHARPRREHSGTVVDAALEIRAEEGDEPVLEVFERAGIEAVVAVLALFAHGHQVVVAQHLEVLRHRRLAQPEFLDDLSDADLARVGSPTSRIGCRVPVEQHL